MHKAIPLNFQVILDTLRPLVRDTRREKHRALKLTDRLMEALLRPPTLACAPAIVLGFRWSRASRWMRTATGGTTALRGESSMLPFWRWIFPTRIPSTCACWARHTYAANA